MQKLYELKDHLCDELCEFAGKDLNSATLETVDKLAHAAKNVGKLIEMCDKEYSERSYSERMSYGDDSSFARGRGRNAKRDSMGRYSRDDDIKSLVHDMKMMTNYLPANKQQDLQKIVDRMEQF